jgi:hypothetical protein
MDLKLGLGGPYFFNIRRRGQMVRIPTFLYHIALPGLQPDVVTRMPLSLVITRKVTIKDEASTICPLFIILLPGIRKIYPWLGTCDTEESEFSSLRLIGLVPESKPLILLDDPPLPAGSEQLPVSILKGVY